MTQNVFELYRKFSRKTQKPFLLKISKTQLLQTAAPEPSEQRQKYGIKIFSSALVQNSKFPVGPRSQLYFSTDSRYRARETIVIKEHAL